MEKNYEAGRKPRLGTPKHPAVVHVQSKKRMKEVAALFEEHGWTYDIQVDPEKPENLADLEILQRHVQTIHAEVKIGRNDPCFCGSGKKFKYCHGK
jgi:SWIM/SEC-C metal-binding protein